MVSEGSLVIEAIGENRLDLKQHEPVMYYNQLPLHYNGIIVDEFLTLQGPGSLDITMDIPNTMYAYGITSNGISVPSGNHSVVVEGANTICRALACSRAEDTVMIFGGGSLRLEANGTPDSIALKCDGSLHLEGGALEASSTGTALSVHSETSSWRVLYMDYVFSALEDGVYQPLSYFDLLHDSGNMEHQAPIRITPNPDFFHDVPPFLWFYEYVKYVTEKGIMNGVSDTEFNPDGQVTRAMMVTMLYRIAGEPGYSPAHSPIYDIPDDAWYGLAVGWAATNGIAEPVNGRFGPNDILTREELAVMTYRFATHRGGSVTGLADLSQFSDAHLISPDAQEAVSWLVAMDIMQGTGDGQFSPLGNTTRAQISAVIQRIMALP